MISNATVLGALGQVGRLLATSLEDAGVRVTRVDKGGSPFPATDCLLCDVTNFGADIRSVIGTADCVCVCLPEKVALVIANRLASLMPDSSLWVDTLSIKSDVVSAVASQAGRIEILSINPMFAPTLGWRNNKVAAVEVSSGPKTTFFQLFLADRGAGVEIISATEHDQLTAAIQVATHAAVLSFGACLISRKFDLEKALRLCTPPHRLLLLLLHRMATQNPDVYWDIQAYHPLGHVVRTDLARAMDAFAASVDSDSPEQFHAMFTDLRKLFAPQSELFRQWSENVFTTHR